MHLSVIRDRASQIIRKTWSVPIFYSIRGTLVMRGKMHYDIRS